MPDFRTPCCLSIFPPYNRPLWNYSIRRDHRPPDQGGGTHGQRADQLAACREVPVELGLSTARATTVVRYLQGRGVNPGFLSAAPRAMLSSGWSLRTTPMRESPPTAGSRSCCCLWIRTRRREYIRYKKTPAWMIHAGVYFVAKVLLTLDPSFPYTPPFSSVIFFVTLCQVIPVSLSPKGI